MAVLAALTCSDKLALTRKDMEEVEDLISVHNADFGAARGAHYWLESLAILRSTHALRCANLTVLYEHSAVLVVELRVPLAVDAKQAKTTWTT